MHLRISTVHKKYGVGKSKPACYDRKFFHDLLHYPGVDPATHLSQYLKYLDLRSDYDFLTY